MYELSVRIFDHMYHAQSMIEEAGDLQDGEGQWDQPLIIAEPDFEVSRSCRHVVLAAGDEVIESVLQSLHTSDDLLVCVEICYSLECCLP